MSRIFVVVMVAVLIFGGVLAADLALQNPDLEPADAEDNDRQQSFVESTTPFLELIPPILLVLTVAVLLGGARVLGGRSI